MSAVVRWAGYVIDLPGAEPGALKRLLVKAFAEGVRITILPNGAAIDSRPGSPGRYRLAPHGRCECPGATFGRLCVHRAMFGLVRSITHGPP